MGIFFNDGCLFICSLSFYYGIWMDLWIWCSSATNRLITAKDHASVQINIGHVDENGVYNGHFSTFALCGFIRAQVSIFFHFFYIRFWNFCLVYFYYCFILASMQVTLLCVCWFMPVINCAFSLYLQCCLMVSIWLILNCILSVLLMSTLYLAKNGKILFGKKYLLH